jgi:hypothetical protein
MTEMTKAERNDIVSGVNRWINSGIPQRGHINLKVQDWDTWLASEVLKLKEEGNSELYIRGFVLAWKHTKYVYYNDGRSFYPRLIRYQDIEELVYESQDDIDSIISTGKWTVVSNDKMCKATETVINETQRCRPVICKIGSCEYNKRIDDAISDDSDIERLNGKELAVWLKNWKIKYSTKSRR